MPGHVTTYIDGKERNLYLKGRTNEGFDDYLERHAGDPRLKMVDSYDLLFQGEICYFTLIADKSDLQSLYEKLKDNELFNCVFQQDKYRPEYWLELCPGNATKAKAIKRLQEMCGCEKVITFGDSLNDISMFEISDECYAVENAMNEVKKISTGIIESNNADGVAKWLEKAWQN